jgi:hypothetical protein
MATDSFSTGRKMAEMGKCGVSVDRVERDIAGTEGADAGCYAEYS